MRVPRVLGPLVQLLIVCVVLGGIAFAWWWLRRGDAGDGDVSAIELRAVQLDFRTHGRANIRGGVANGGPQDAADVTAEVVCHASGDAASRRTAVSLGAVPAGQTRSFWVTVPMPPPAGGRAFEPGCTIEVTGVTPVGARP
jgi:hypothetical protein